jgi:hypothetical protein
MMGHKAGSSSRGNKPEPMGPADDLRSSYLSMSGEAAGANEAGAVVISDSFVKPKVTIRSPKACRSPSPLADGVRFFPKNFDNHTSSDG